MLDLKTLLTHYTTWFTSAVVLVAEYWINFMDAETKTKIIEALGDNGQWITPLALFVVWVVLKAKKQGPSE